MIKKKLLQIWHRTVVLWQKPLNKAAFCSVVGVIILYFFVSFIFLRPPADFPVGTIYTIYDGSGLNTVTKDLVSKKIIRSNFWFKTFSVIFGGPKALVAGDYVLDQRVGIPGLAWRLAQGDYHLEAVRITFREGLNVQEIGQLLESKFPNITAKEFEEKAQKSEGYLFPDTYLFLPNIKAKDVIEEMKKTFSQKIIELQTDLDKFNRPLNDIMKMASIVEEEARTKESRQIVAGILWKRLSIGMPLQVDSSFKYINGKTTKNLTLNDLKIDSPYNSYLYKGLPPTPISNPGLDSILATITPIETDYLYFLTGHDGKMYYAKTFAGHLQNKKIYLN